MQRRIERVDLKNEDAFKEIQDFCCDAGLPFFIPVRGNLLAQFVVRDPKGKVCAAARLEYSFDHPFVEEVAVREDLRGTGLGKMVVEAVLEEARKRGIKTIWAMAREPGFFKKMGFGKASEAELLAKLMEQCRECRDYPRICNPVLVKKKLIE